MSSDDGGSVLLEFVMVVPLFVLLFLGAVDYGFIRREQYILSEAARAAVRATLIAMPFSVDEYAQETPEQQKATYLENRYRRSITLARYLVAANGLDPDSYTYRIFDVERDDPAGGKAIDTVQLNISSRAASKRFVIIPDSAFKACVGASGIISGLVLGTGRGLADPADADEDDGCAPEAA